MSGTSTKRRLHSIKKFFHAANQTAEAVNRQIIHITQRNLNSGLDLAKSLASARDPSEIAKLQASFWWKQFNEFTAQAEEVRKRLFGFSAVPEPTPEPGLKEPATESLTRPQQGHRPTARDPTTPRAKQKPVRRKVETPTLAAQTPKAAKSEVARPKPRPQRSTAEKRSARSRSTSRDPARKQGERKPQATRTPTRQITRADAPRPHERQSRSPKKGAPHEPAPQVLPMGVKFGMLDGNAVRFTNFEAWWLVDGAWRPISPGEVLSNAAVMREANSRKCSLRCLSFHAKPSSRIGSNGLTVAAALAARNVARHATRLVHRTQHTRHLLGTFVWRVARAHKVRATRRPPSPCRPGRPSRRTSTLGRQTASPFSEANGNRDSHRCSLSTENHSALCLSKLCCFSMLFATRRASSLVNTLAVSASVWVARA